MTRKLKFKKLKDGHGILPHASPNFSRIMTNFPQSKPKKKPVEVDVTKHESSDELFFTVKDGNGYFRPKTNHIINLVKICGILSPIITKYDQVIWKTNDSTKFSKLVVIDNIGFVSTPNNVSVFYTNDDIVHYFKSGNLWLKKHLFIDLDLKNADTCYEFFHRKYEISSLTARFNFRFKSVSYGNRQIWQARDSGEYAKIIEFSGDSTFSPPSSINVFLESGEIVHFTRSGKTWVVVTPTVILDVSRRHNTIDIDFTQRKSGNACVFEAKGNFTIKEVIETNSSFSNNCDDIWECKKGLKCAKKVVLKYSTEVGDYLGLYLVDGGVLVFHRPEKRQPWVTSSNTALVSDINSASVDLTAPRKFINRSIALHANKVAGQFFTVDNNLITRTCTYRAFEGSSFCALLIDDVEVWKTDDKEALASKVVLKTDGTNDIYAAVVLDNGGFLLFNRAEIGQPWVDITESRHNILDIKMIGLDPLDHSNLIDIEPTMYFLKTEFISYVIQFEKGIKCIELQYLSKTVWTFKKKYPLKFLFNMRTNRMFVFYSEDSYKEIKMVRSRS